MNRKKILFIDNHRWAQFHSRGKVMASFLEAGHEITAAAPDSSYISDNNTIPGVRQISFKLERTSAGLSSNLRTFLDIFRIVGKTRSDLVFLYTIKPILFGALACLLLRRRYVAVFAGISAIIQRNSPLGHGFCHLLRLLLFHATEVIVLNEEDSRLLLSRKVVSLDRLFVLKGGEGVDLEKYAPVTEGYSAGTSFTFLLIARLLWNKGIGEYVEAAAKLKRTYPACRFLLCGEFDPYHPEAVPEAYIREAEQRGIIEYRGRINDVVRQVREADCFVLPSFYNEGMNRSLMEALALGKVLITTDHKGCREMVRNGSNGLLIPVRDANALYDAMEKILSLPETELGNMGRNSRRLAEEVFDVKWVIEHYHSLVER